MTTTQRRFAASTGVTGLTRKGGKVHAFTFREGGTKANFYVRFGRGWLPSFVYIAVPVFGKWFRGTLGRVSQ